MSFIAGSHEWLKQNGYSCRRTGALEYTIFDEEASDSIVCKGESHAEAVRNLINLRFAK